MDTLSRILFCVHLAIAANAINQAAAQTNPLPSWNDTAAKKSIVSFVPPAQRIATFDNDGTLWVESPVYTQVIFAFDRVKQLAPQRPEWKTRQPFI